MISLQKQREILLADCRWRAAGYCDSHQAALSEEANRFAVWREERTEATFSTGKHPRGAIQWLEPEGAFATHCGGIHHCTGVRRGRNARIRCRGDEGGAFWQIELQTVGAANRAGLPPMRDPPTADGPHNKRSDKDRCRNPPAM